MIWNVAKQVNPPFNILLNLLVTQNIPGVENVLLGYNEPDGTDTSAQACMHIDEAVQYWPQLVATGRRLGSPVMYGDLIKPPTDDTTKQIQTYGIGKNIQNVPQPTGITLAADGTVQINISNDLNNPNLVQLNPLIWLDNFLIQLSQDYKTNQSKYARSPFPDFITIHWYGVPDAQGFLNYLQSVNNKYKLPIWVTEYSVADWNATWDSTIGANGQPNGTVHTAGYDWQYPTDQNINTNGTAQFMRQTVAGMNNMSFVERYSWKERFLLSSPGTPATNNNSVAGPSNIDTLGQSTLFQSYQHFPTTVPSLTPLGKLYASL